MLRLEELTWQAAGLCLRAEITISHRDQPAARIAMWAKTWLTAKMIDPSWFAPMIPAAPHVTLKNNFTRLT